MAKHTVYVDEALTGNAHRQPMVRSPEYEHDYLPTFECDKKNPCLCYHYKCITLPWTCLQIFIELTDVMAILCSKLRNECNISKLILNITLWIKLCSYSNEYYYTRFNVQISAIVQNVFRGLMYFPE